MAETFLYLTLGTNDLARAARFYDAALAPLGLVRRATKDSEIGYAFPPTGAQGSGSRCPSTASPPASATGRCPR